MERTRLSDDGRQGMGVDVIVGQLELLMVMGIRCVYLVVIMGVFVPLHVVIQVERK
jgi:hypothetical protein